MLVLAAPRPPDSQDVVPEKDVTITEKYLESSYTELFPLDASIDPNLLVPLSALSARARHREKVRIDTLLLLFQTKPGSLKTSKMKRSLNFNHYLLCTLSDFRKQGFCRS